MAYTLQELEAIRDNALEAGDQQAAGKVQAVIGRYLRESKDQTATVLSPTGAPMQVPVEQANQIVPETNQQAPTTLGQKLKGAADAALSMGQGVLAGTVGAAGATIGAGAGLIASGEYGTPEGARRFSETVGGRVDAMQRAPATETGAQYLENIGEAVEPLTYVTDPLIGGGRMLGNIAESAGQVGRTTGAIAAATPQAANRAVVQPTVRAAQQAGAKIAEPVASLKQRLTRKPEEVTPLTPDQIDPFEQDISLTDATQRAADARRLPVDPELTEAQITRDPNALRERADLRRSEQGRPILEQDARQNQLLRDNFAEITANLKSQASDNRTRGEAIDSVLIKQLEKDRKAENDAWTAADEAAGETQKIAFSNLASFFNENGYLVGSDATIDQALKLAKNLKLVDEIDGNYTATSASVKNASVFRKKMNERYGSDAAANRLLGKMKGAIDDTLINDDVGAMYKKAVTQSREKNQKWNDFKLVKDLTSAARQGSQQRKVAFENIVSRVYQTSTTVDEIRQLKGVFAQAGSDGRNAWREVKAGVLQDLQDAAFKNSATDIRSQPEFSVAGFDNAIKKLDQDGKLDLLLGKGTAQTVRALRNVAKYQKQNIAGTVNNSGTGAYIKTMLADMTAFMTAGVPLPVASSIKAAKQYFDNQRTQREVIEAIKKADLDKF